MSNQAYRAGYLDGITNKPRRGGLLYTVYGTSWKAYQRGYSNGEKQLKGKRIKLYA